jgi:hypothetical protein
MAKTPLRLLSNILAAKTLTLRPKAVKLVRSLLLALHLAAQRVDWIQMNSETFAG